jgi:hypothetical protein
MTITPKQSAAILDALKTLVAHAQEKYPHFEDTRGQRDIQAALDAIAAVEQPPRWSKRMIIDAANSVVKKTIDGRVYAVRFARGMTEQQILLSIERDPIAARDWRKYNESTNEFIS